MKRKPVRPITIWYEIDDLKGTIAAFEVARTGDSMFTTPDGHRQRYDRSKHFQSYEKARTTLLENVTARERFHAESGIRLRATLAKAQAQPVEKPALFEEMEKLAASKSYELPTYSNAEGAKPGRVIERV